jgi:hypothetical protein
VQITADGLLFPSAAGEKSVDINVDAVLALSDGGAYVPGESPLLCVAEWDFTNGDAPAGGQYIGIAWNGQANQDQNPGAGSEVGVRLREGTGRRFSINDGTNTDDDDTYTYGTTDQCLAILSTPLGGQCLLRADVASNDPADYDYDGDAKEGWRSSRRSAAAGAASPSATPALRLVSSAVASVCRRVLIYRYRGYIA